MPKLTIMSAAVCAASVQCCAQLDEADASCGTVLTAEGVVQARALVQEGAYEAPAERLVITVPIVYHVVRSSQGLLRFPAGVHLEDRILRSIPLLNGQFEGSGIRFCQAGPPIYIDSDFWNDWQAGARLDDLRQVGLIEGVVNVYITPNPVTFSGISAFTWSEIQSIAVNMHDFVDILGIPNSTLTHEMGHYFDLLHTHETMFGQECASRENCATAGDLLCDTQVDHGYAVVARTCQLLTPPPYPGPCPGDPMYFPNPLNYMSFDSTSCCDHFTQGQKDRAYATLVNIRHELSRTMCACPVDCDLNGVLDINDYFCFLDAFIEEEPYACDMSTTGARVCDIFDFLAFQDAFVAGCP